VNINEYKQRVIELFQSGKATEGQWQEMAECVLLASEDEVAKVTEIDRVVDPRVSDGRYR
jgi:hypothetical protein